MTEKNVPNNIEECKKFDEISKKVANVSDSLEAIGVVLCIIILIAGVIFSFANHDIFGGWGVFISLLVSVVIAFINYYAFHISSAIVMGVARIVYNTEVSSNVALYNSANSFKNVDKKSGVNENINN
ncbi:hypothetical protein [Ruminococcus sp.]|uniref:hypothetical protein n=1 Tax=Ruminococcus sp. TaxID=41978 RepID=UPI003864F13C